MRIEREGDDAGFVACGRACAMDQGGVALVDGIEVPDGEDGGTGHHAHGIVAGDGWLQKDPFRGKWWGWRETRWVIDF